MPVHTYRIGPHTFEDLQGNLIKRGEKLEIFSRPGIDGVGARKTGKRTGPFTVTSVHYVLDFQAARDAVTTYQAMRGVDPVEVIQHSISHGTYLVVDVQQVRVEAVLGVGSTLVTDPEVRQICQWTLIG